MSISIEIPNLKNFERGLQSFPVKLAKAVMRKALKEAGQLLLKEMKIQVPKRFLHLEKSLDGKGKAITEVEATYIVGSYSNSDDKHAPFYAPLVEYGSRWVLKRKGKVIASGKRGPEPYMRPAFEITKEEMQNVIVKTIGDAAAKQWKKVGGG